MYQMQHTLPYVLKEDKLSQVWDLRYQQKSSFASANTQIKLDFQWIKEPQTSENEEVGSWTPPPKKSSSNPASCCCVFLRVVVECGVFLTTYITENEQNVPFLRDYITKKFHLPSFFRLQPLNFKEGPAFESMHLLLSRCISWYLTNDKLEKNIP